MKLPLSFSGEMGKVDTDEHSHVATDVASAIYGQTSAVRKHVDDFLERSHNAT